MNQQIKQLLGQAYDEAVPETWTTLSSEQLGRVYEKFALLIVQECMKLNRDILCEDDPDYLDQVYKEHFGVES